MKATQILVNNLNNIIDINFYQMIKLKLVILNTDQLV